MPKVTDSVEMFTAIAYFQHDGNFDEFVCNDEGRELVGTLALSSLIPSEIETYSMKRVLEFHKKSAEGRVAFRETVSQLIEELKDIKDRNFFEKRLQQFDEELRKSQMSVASALTTGGADLAYALITAGLPMAMGSLGIIGMLGDPWTMQSLGASALFGVTATLADHARSRRTKWSSKEASYWLSLNSAFKSEKGVTMRLPNFHKGFEEFIND